MAKIRNMDTRDLDTVAELLATEYNLDSIKGFTEAKEHTEDHLKSVPQHCFVAEVDNQIVGALVLHPQENIFEIEDFHVKEVQKNRDAATKLKAKVLVYLEDVKCEVLCCPDILRRLMTT